MSTKRDQPDVRYELDSCEQLSLQHQLIEEARTAALSLFRKVNASGAVSLSYGEQRVLSSAVRVIERPGIAVPTPDELEGAE